MRIQVLYMSKHCKIIGGVIRKIKIEVLKLVCKYVRYINKKKAATFSSGFFTVVDQRNEISNFIHQDLAALS